MFGLARTGGKLFSQALLLLGPMLTLGWSFLDFIGVLPDQSGNVQFSILGIPVSGKKATVEMTLRVAVTLTGFALLVLYEFIDIILPRRDLRQFRDIYLEQQKKEWRNDPENQIPLDVRLNIMHVRRTWYTLWLVGRFSWTWNDGFEPPHQSDAGVLLFSFQGVAGAAYRARAPKGVDLRNARIEVDPALIGIVYVLGLFAFLILSGVTLLASGFWVTALLLVTFWFVVSLYGVAMFTAYCNNFRLWPFQIRKTSNVKYVLSVPIFKASKGASKTFKCVGVINLDTTSDLGAEFLRLNEGRLVRYFLDCGKVIACLR